VPLPLDAPGEAPEQLASVAAERPLAQAVSNTGSGLSRRSASQPAISFRAAAAKRLDRPGVLASMGSNQPWVTWRRSPGRRSRFASSRMASNRAPSPLHAFSPADPSSCAAATRMR
jgi:hypothetical protein